MMLYWNWLGEMMHGERKHTSQLTPRLVIVEGVESTFHYHIARERKTTRGLCGAETIHTSIPLSAWGVRTHLRERYCPTCEKYLDTFTPQSHAK